MKILITGAAGFIGFHLSKVLGSQGHTVVGVDNLNDYYDQRLKYGRLKELGVSVDHTLEYNSPVPGSSNGLDFQFIKIDLQDREALSKLFKKESFDVVCNMAAQAGVRYSLENPESYIDSNIVGFLTILECCRHYHIKHLVYASSSSIYGLNKKVPFSTLDRVDTPISLYAASKRSNELMAHVYSHLYSFRTTGLRFFTVYGPWGRPDMALFLFTNNILENHPIKIFNNGNMSRDFTYVDDIVEGIRRIVGDEPKMGLDKSPLYNIYNIGNNKSVDLMDFVTAIEKKLGMEAKKEFLPIQPGDVEKTWANVDDLAVQYDYRPNTPINRGIGEFIDWYKEFYGID